MPHSKTSPRQELLQIEKRIFQQNQQTINDSTDVRDKNFKKYYRTYKRAIKAYQRVVDVQTIENDISKSRVILVGDYHTLDQSQRSFVRVLRSYFRSHDKDFVVALETIQARHDKHLDQFMAGKINETLFIKKTGFKKSWFFDLWGNYVVIFDFLKYHHVATFGIEMTGHENRSLLERDIHMAERIVELAKRYPDKKICVLVGDLHLAPQHLPREIETCAKRNKIKLPTLVLYQNSPEIYWRLSEKELVDHTLTVQIKEKSYCRMHTPPIIVQQSYINWLYHEEGVFDWVDAKGSFVQIVERVAQVLGLKLPADYENIEVYTCGDLGFMKLLSRKKLFTKKEMNFIRTQIENSESYFLSKARIAYIANVSIHHAAEEASHYLKFLLSGLETPRSHKDAFYANVLHEALGFFGSKLINAKRKCARIKDFRAQKIFLEHSNLAQKRHVEFETALLFIQNNKQIQKGQLFHTNKVMTFSTEMFLALSHALGYDLGDLLYYAFMDGKVDKKLMQQLFKNPFSDEGEPGEVYLDLVKKLKGVKRPMNI